MCNAYGLRAPIHKIAETFAHLRIPLRFEGGSTPNLEPRELIRPTEAAVVVVGEGEGAVLRPLTWGFAPSAVKRPLVINFRSEGRRFGAGRALVLASWFFEVTGDRYPKARHRFTKLAREPDAESADGGGEEEDPFAIAGLVRAAGAAPDGKPWPESFTMLTCAPGPDVLPLHDRQVVVLERADWGVWLNGPAEAAQALLAPSPAGTFAVSRDR